MEIKKDAWYSVIFIFVILFMLTFCSYVKAADYRITGGMTNDINIGVDMPNDSLHKLDLGYNIRTYYNNFFWDLEPYITGIYNNEITGGGGFRLRGGYYITGNFSIFLGAGLVGIIDGGDIDNLASSWLYGSLEGGVEYKQFVLGIDHVSSPFHNGEDGDYGFNTIYIGIKF